MRQSPSLFHCNAQVPLRVRARYCAGMADQMQGMQAASSTSSPNDTIAAQTSRCGEDTHGTSIRRYGVARRINVTTTDVVGTNHPSKRICRGSAKALKCGHNHARYSPTSNHMFHHMH